MPLQPVTADVSRLILLILVKPKGFYLKAPVFFRSVTKLTL